MTRDDNGDAPPETPRRSYEPLTPEQFKRLVERARRRGESTTPLVRRLVLTTIDEIAAKLGREGGPEDDG